LDVSLMDRNQNIIFDIAYSQLKELRPIMYRMQEKNLLYFPGYALKSPSEGQIIDWAKKLRDEKNGTPSHACLKYCTGAYSPTRLSWEENITTRVDFIHPISHPLKISSVFFNSLPPDAKSQYAQVLDENDETILLRTVDCEDNARVIEKSDEFVSFVEEILNSISPNERQSYILSKSNDKTLFNDYDLYSEEYFTGKEGKNILHIFATSYFKKTYLLAPILLKLPNEKDIFKCLKSTDDEGNNVLHYLVNNTDVDIANVIENIMNMVTEEHRIILLTSKNKDNKTPLDKVFSSNFQIFQNKDKAIPLLESVLYNNRAKLFTETERQNLFQKICRLADIDSSHEGSKTFDEMVNDPKKTMGLLPIEKIFKLLHEIPSENNLSDSEDLYS